MEELKLQYIILRKELIKYYETGESTESLINLLEHYDEKYNI